MSRRVYFSCINIVSVKNVLFMACSCYVIVILRRCILIMNVVLIIASGTFTPNALRMTREGDTMHRDKVPSHMYHKICSYQRDATSHMMDWVQADLRNAKCGQLARKDCVERIASGIY